MRRLSILAAFALLTGCAQGERFGLDGPAGDDPPALEVECDSDADCWDGDPLTEDTCGDDGLCHFSLVGDQDTDTDTSDVDDGCEFVTDLDGDDQFLLLVDEGVGELSPTIPLSMGQVVKIHVRESRRVWLDAMRGAEDDVMLVLLRDCANAAVNRIAWGPRIYTEELQEGFYYLGVFAREPTGVNIDARFLKPTYCDAAFPLDIGLNPVNVDGLADDFEGGCLEGENPLDHRGDAVFTFEVPQGKLWDVFIDLYPSEGYLRHHLYMTLGCGNSALTEIDCSSVLEESTGGQDGGGEAARIRGKKLKPGQYYVFIDALKPQDWNVGPVDVVFSVESSLAQEI